MNINQSFRSESSAVVLYITVVNICISSLCGIIYCETGHTCMLSCTHSRLRDLTAQCCFWPSGSSRVPWKTQPKCPAVHKERKTKSKALVHQSIRGPAPCLRSFISFVVPNNEESPKLPAVWTALQCSGNIPVSFIPSIYLSVLLFERKFSHIGLACNVLWG